MEADAFFVRACRARNLPPIDGRSIAVAPHSLFLPPHQPSPGRSHIDGNRVAHTLLGGVGERHVGLAEGEARSSLERWHDTERVIPWIGREGLHEIPSAPRVSPLGERHGRRRSHLGLLVIQRRDEGGHDPTVVRRRRLGKDRVARGPPSAVRNERLPSGRQAAGNGTPIGIDGSSGRSGRFGVLGIQPVCAPYLPTTGTRVRTGHRRTYVQRGDLHP